MPASSMASATPGAAVRDQSAPAPEDRGVRGRRCPAAWPHVADAVIEACTAVATWSTIGLSERFDHDGCEGIAVWLALLRVGAPQPGGALRP
jgi:hypothetical protein